MPPLGRVGTPRTRKPSSRGVMRTPRARSAVVTVSIRSVSFTRSSRAPSTLLSPRAQRGGEREQRQLVDQPRHLLGARPRSRSARPSWTSRSPTGSPPLRCRWKSVIRAPMRSSTSSRPVRVGLSPTSWIVSSRAGQQRRGDEERRRCGEVAGHRDRAAAEALGRPDRHAALALRRPARRRRASMRSVWSRVGTGSTTVVRPVGVEPGEQNARLHLGARDRELVTDAVQLAALDAERQAARRRSRRWRPSRASGSAMRSIGRAPQRLVAGQLEAAFLAGEDPGEQAQRRARRCRSRSGPRAARRPRRPAPVDAHRVDSSSCTVTPSARTAAIVDSVSAERPKPSTSVSPSAIAPTRTARCEIDLSPGTAMSPAQRGRRLDLHSASTGETTTP